MFLPNGLFSTVGEPTSSLKSSLIDPTTTMKLIPIIKPQLGRFGRLRNLGLGGLVVEPMSLIGIKVLKIIQIDRLLSPTSGRQIKDTVDAFGDFVKRVVDIFTDRFR